jgi:hypothetical protein
MSPNKQKLIRKILADHCDQLLSTHDFWDGLVDQMVLEIEDVEFINSHITVDNLELKVSEE